MKATVIGTGMKHGEEKRMGGYDNHIIPAEDIFPDAEEGETVEAQISGTVIMKDGKKCIQVNAVDGEDVESSEVEEPQEEEVKDSIKESRGNLINHMKENNKGRSHKYA